MMVQKVDYLLLVFILINIYFFRIAGLGNNLEKASLVSYDPRASSRHTTQLSSSYDPKAGTSYFDQRFTDRTAIGKGSFSTVWKTKSLDDQQWYAVKEENIDFWVSAEFKLREVEAWELLSPHPGIAHFFMAWREKRNLYFQSELCTGDLDKYMKEELKSKCVPEATSWHVLEDLLPAFEHIHAKGRVFVDVKRDNILLCNGEQASAKKNKVSESSSSSTQNSQPKNSKQRAHFKLTDFGLCFDPSNDTQDTTDTIIYCMYSGIYWKIMFGAMKVKSLHITPALDIGGFGLMLLEQTIGLEKFQSLESNTLAEIHEMVSKRVFSESDMSPKLARIISRMIEPNPKNRATAKELLDQIVTQ